MTNSPQPQKRSIKNYKIIDLILIPFWTAITLFDSTTRKEMKLFISELIEYARDKSKEVDLL